MAYFYFFCPHLFFMPSSDSDSDSDSDSYHKKEGKALPTPTLAKPGTAMLMRRTTDAQNS
jgi:hypothetical protein